MNIKNSIRQFYLVIRENISLRRVIFNKVLVLIIIVLIASVGVQGYISSHDDGQISGTVLGPNGEPVPNATVTIQSVGVQNVGSQSSTKTNNNGKFVFSNRKNLLKFKISANKIDIGNAPQETIHLYYKGQSIQHTVHLHAT